MFASEEIWQCVITIVAAIVIYEFSYFFYDRFTYARKSNSKTGWNYPFKVLWARWVIIRDRRRRRNQRKLKNGVLTSNKNKSLLPTQAEFQLEAPIPLLLERSVDMLSIWAGDKEGNSFLVRLFRHRHRLATLWFSLRLKDGSTLCFPDAPNAVVQNAWTKEWSASGLRMKVIEPLRRWRITFKGLLRRRPPGSTEADDTDDQVQFVKFNFLWIACSDFADYRRNTSSKLLARAIAREPWRSEHWNAYFREMGKGYEQWGIVQGNVWLSNEETVNLYLRGLRQRWCGLDPATWQNRFVQIIAVMPEGTMVSLRGLESSHGLSLMTYGQVREANGNLQIVDWTNFSLEPWGEKAGEHLPQALIHLSAGGRSYSLVLHLRFENEQLRFFGQLPSPWEARCSDAAAGLNHLQGYAHVDMMFLSGGPFPIEKISPVTRLYDLSLQKSSTDMLVLSLDDRECRSSAFVGGKAASLALLRSLNDSQFRVPGGFCLTPRALEAQLNANPEVKEAIQALAETSEKDFSDNCLKASRLLRESTLCSEVESAFAQALHNLLPDDTLCVAVRSSALGEDSDDVSAAGQNDTFLGVPLRAEPLSSSLLACWASLYSEAAIIYRRRHGQPVGLDASMAVVVQSMVSPRAAGVLFTNHPVTGDPSKMIITANYGLGESVVSASAEPDTIEVHRDWRGKLSISNRIIGAKSLQIVAQDLDEISDRDQISGTRSENVPDSERSKLCITEEEILLLASTGARFEAMFGDARDIEWALDIDKGHLWILQARPITTQNAWTEYELLHEFDSAFASEKEVATRANVGEVMPQCRTALTLCIERTFLEKAIKTTTNLKNHYSVEALTFSHYHNFLNVLNVLLRHTGSELSVQQKVAFMTTLASDLITPEIHSLAVERHGIMKPSTTLKMLLTSIMIAKKSTKYANAATNISQTVKFSEISNDDLVLFHACLTSNTKKLFKVMESHSYASMGSSFCQIILASMLLGSNKEITPRMKNEMSHLLANCNKNIISAEIPQLLRSIANEAGPELADAPPGGTFDWLRENRPKAAQALEDFLQRHGHRCLNEFELASIPWKMNPENVCDMLRAICLEPKEKLPVEPSKPFERSVTGLRGRFIYDFLVPWIHTQVANRETSKSALILMVDNYRQGYLRLARALVAKGRLPQIDLIWHLTHTELGRLVQSPDPELIDKAWKRQKFHPKWMKIRFPKIVIGIPEPIEVNNNIKFKEGIAHLEGTSVSSGTVMGRACVVEDLNEASQIKSGDILITYSTDIGWSPYFSKLSGLITELGGLISHGAVVAREYGLPCVVGALDATKIFHTGDTILLAADTGIIELITKHEEKTPE